MAYLLKPLTIRNNPNLSSLNGLHNLMEVSWTLSIENNDNLIDLTGVENLTRVSYLQIKNNPMFCSLSGLSALDTLSSTIIENNQSLTTLDGLDSITTALEIHIFGNDNLVSLQGLNNLQTLTSFEGGLSLQQVNVLPNNVNISPDASGKYFLYGDQGTPYIIDWLDDSNWSLTTDFPEYMLTFVSGDAANDNNSFGLFPTSMVHDLSASVSSAPTICDTEVTFYLRFPNIYLPPESIDELGSQGFVTYEIKPISGLPDFTVIENIGHIYFDQNPAIITNTTSNTMVDIIPTSTKNLDANAISIFPNPTSNTFFIKTPDGAPIDQVLLYNQLGELVLGSQQQQIEVDHLPAGLYFLKVELEGLKWMGKLMID